MKFVRHNIPLTIFGAIALGLALYLWLISWTSISIGPFYGPKALTNPYLAAEMFLNSHGVTIEHHGNTSDLDTAIASSDVLLMTNQSGDLSDEQFEALFDWVDAGGTLIYQPTTLYAEDGKYFDRVLARTSQRLVVNQKRDRTHTPSPNVHHADVTCPESKDTTFVSLDSDRRLQINLANDVVLMPTSDSNSAPSITYAEPNWGNANFVILTDLRPWRNNLIQCHDNARFLHHLVVRDSEGDIQLAWLDGVESRALYAQLWHWFPQSILTLAVLLLWWLWNRIPREQPITAKTESRKNALEDYLLRKAIFRWHSVSSLEHLKPLRAEILGRTRLGYTQADYERLANATGNSVEEIKAALNGNAWLGERELVKLVATLSRIRGIG